jgi:LysM repeat protein
MPTTLEIARNFPTEIGAALAQQWSTRTRPGHNLPWPWIVMQANARDTWTCFLLGPEGAHVAEGYAEWEQFARPRQTAVTEWRKMRNLKLTVDALYDGFAIGGRSIEGEITKLEALAEGGTGGEDATVKLFGPIPRITNKRWAIETLEWGDFIRHIGGIGERLRQQVTIKLLEYVAPTNIIQVPAATTRKYTLVRGDDLQKIAKKMLGKANRWKEIEKLNKGMRGIKINTKLFPAGKQITIPAK